MGLDGKKLEPESNVLLASIENMQYAVTLDVLHTVNTTLCIKFLEILQKTNFLDIYCSLLFFMSGVQVFAAFGPVLKIAMFDKNGGLQALIQYPGKISQIFSIITEYYFFLFPFSIFLRGVWF